MIREKLEFPEHEQVDFVQSQINDDFKARLGMGALASELVTLDAQYKQEKHDANRDFIDAYNSRSWWRTKAPSTDEVSGWSQAHYKTTDLSEARKQAREEGDKSWHMEHDYIDMTRQHLSTVREAIDSFPEHHKGILSTNIANRLEEYANDTNNTVDNLAFSQWKKAAEDKQGAPLSWAEWLTRPTDRYATKLTPEDRQLLNFLQWNQHHYNSVNSDPEVRKDFQNRSKNLAGDLEELVKKDKIDPEIYRNYLRRPIQATIGEPLDVGLIAANGYARVDKPFIVLAPGFKQGTYVHERMHQVGSLGDTFWNEAATQYIADEVDMLKGNEFHDTPYVKGVHLLEDILKVAHMNSKDLSSYFAHDDYDGFMSEVKHRTGVDFDKAYQLIKTEAYKRYPQDVEMAEYFIAYEVPRIFNKILTPGQ